MELENPRAKKANSCTPRFLPSKRQVLLESRNGSIFSDLEPRSSLWISFEPLVLGLQYQRHLDLCPGAGAAFPSCPDDAFTHCGYRPLWRSLA
jgi:hypothetical protein